MQQGSPPRWRGKAPPYRMRPVGGGITPALAGKSLHFSHFLGGGQDHPRVGGEKYGGPCVCLRSPGSPPRWRGKVHDQKLPAGARGITPAWAGKSCLADLFPAGRKDHPRVGGEKKTVPFEVGGGKGSPPRGRGKGILHPMHCPHGRITPAWAGKSSGPLRFFACSEDHPRVGGEKTSRGCQQKHTRGSPPRGRGKVTRLYALADLEGITPAWAGKRPQTAHRVKPQQDHPRVGGEKSSSRSSAAAPRGSPPRGRGKVDGGFLGGCGLGITPAWAGKSQQMLKDASHGQDHPRVGGEKSGPVMLIKAVRGSPPRGRGKGLGGLALVHATRITPAWAGKRQPGAGKGSARMDHPRVGGEKLSSSHPSGSSMGSPPRGRGKGCSANHLEVGGEDHPRVGGEKSAGAFFFSPMSGSPPRGRGKACQESSAGGSAGITPAWAGKSSFRPRHPRRCRDHPRVGGEKEQFRPNPPLDGGSPPRGRGKD